MVVLFLLLALGLLIGVNFYLQSNEKKIIENTPLLNQGTISFENAYLTIFKDFPNASLVLRQVEVIDAQHPKHQVPLLTVDELTANLSLKAWRAGVFKVKKLRFDQGTLQLHQTLDGYHNLVNIFPASKSASKTKIHPQLPEIKIEADNIDFELVQFNLKSHELQKKRFIELLAKSARGKVQINNGQIKCLTNLEAKILDMTFNEAQGSFLKEAWIKGSFEVAYQDQQLDIAPTSIKINDQHFLFHALIGTTPGAYSKINLQNTKTNQQETLRLLPKPISKKIAPYQVKGTFYTNTQIELQAPYTPKVEVQFQIPDNDLVIQGIEFKNASTRGHFVNRSSLTGQQMSKQRGAIQLKLNRLSARQSTFDLSANELLISAQKGLAPIINSELTIGGPAVAISDWYQNDKFLFEEGQFLLKGTVHGPLNDINELILESSAHLSLRDLSVHYQPADVAIPVDELELYKQIGDAKFSITSTTLSRQHDYRMDGGLKNLTGLLVAFAKKSTTSEVRFAAKHLGWLDFVNMFSLGSKKSKQQSKDEKSTKEAMKKTFRGIYHKIHPKLNIAIDTFDYLDKIRFYNIQTGTHFNNENILVLEQTRFDLDQGNLLFDAKLDISNPYQTTFDLDLQATNINLQEILPIFNYFNIKILSDQVDLPEDFNLSITLHGIIDDVKGLLPNSAKGVLTFQSKKRDNVSGKVTFEPSDALTTNQISTQIELAGNPKLFNDFFNNDKFFFQDTGRFELDLSYQGALDALDQILDAGVADFSISDGAVYYKDVDIIFPLDDLQVQLNRDTLDYQLHMYSAYFDRVLDIDGKIRNVSELLLGNTGKPLSTVVEAYSPIINLDHAVEIFETPPDTTAPLSNQQVDEKIKKLITSLFNRFNPSLSTQIDTFILSEKIALTAFNTGCYFSDSTHLVLKQTGFQFARGTFQLNGNIDLGNTNEEAFTTEVSTKNLNLSELLYRLDFFGIPDLEQAERIDGTVNIELDYDGSLRDLTLLEEKNRATLGFNIEDLELRDIEVINQIARKLMVKRLFKEIEFAPITNTVTITGSTVDIPLMEVNSTGINFFLEGTLGNGQNTNLWISLPADNIRKLRKKEIPFKRGYAATKRKIHLEIYQDQKGKMRKKIRLSKKRFYKKTGKLDQFKKDKNRYKATRRKKRAKALPLPSAIE